MPNHGPLEREKFLMSALDAMPVGISWATLSDQMIIYMNRRFTEIFGYIVGDFNLISDWIGRYPVFAHRKLASERWAEYFENPDGREYSIKPMELLITCKDGTVKTILHSGVILPEADWALATFVDITDRKNNELLLQEAKERANENEARYRMLLDYSKEMISLSSFDGSHRDVSPGVQRVIGWTPAEYLAMPINEVVHPDDLNAVTDAVRAVAAGAPPKLYRGRLKHKDGGYRWIDVELRGYMDLDSKRPAGYVAIMRDVSEQKRQEDLLVSENLHLAADASHDELTRIANRRLFNVTLRREVRRQTRKTQAMALLMVDIDLFKQYNDHYGHLGGDEVLKRVASVLEMTLKRDSDLVARFGGEEFVILLPMTESDGAEQLASATLNAVRALAIPHIYSSLGILTVSVGVACWPAGIAADPEWLLQQADAALYRAKNSGRNAYSVIYRKAQP